MFLKNTDPLLSFSRVTKQFSGIVVINAIDFEVYAGEIVALLGVNGAGKTTTLSMALGLEIPSGGVVKLFGSSPLQPQARRALGVLFQTLQFPEHLTVREVIEFVQSHYERSMTVQELSQEFFLESLLEKKAGLLSEGQKRAVALALAFVGRPRLVFLDEPTVGLDIRMRKRIWHSIKKYVQTGGAVLLTTHYLEEAEHLASRILILEKGTITKTGTVDDIKKDSASVHVTFNAMHCPTTFSYGCIVEQNDNYYVVNTAQADELIRELVQKDVPFTDLRVVRKSLEDIFIQS